MALDSKTDFGAAYQLGQMHLKGRGVPNDTVEGSGY